VELSELKAKVFALLKEDLEFRYAVAGLLGYEELLKRLDRHEEELTKVWTEIAKLREDMNKLIGEMASGFKRHDEALERFAQELVRLREEMASGFKRHDEALERHERELAKLREDMNKLIGEMASGFKRHDEALERHERELAKLRDEMAKGFELVKRRLDALGARWGLMAEEAFCEGLRRVLKEELGLSVERWVKMDVEGYVYDHPCQVDVDVAVSNGRVVLIEMKSHVKRADVTAFKRKAELYAKIEGRRPDKLMIVTPYADQEALETAKELEIEVYTGV